MSVIYDYFKKASYNVEIEPLLNYGRADIGVYSQNMPIYFEVGTVSLYKLWYNLSSMKNAIFIIVPTESKLIKFIV